MALTKIAGLWEGPFPSLGLCLFISYTGRLNLWRHLRLCKGWLGARGVMGPEDMALNSRAHSCLSGVYGPGEETAMKQLPKYIFNYSHVSAT